LKLLFDENLAPSLAASLAALYPESAHVHSLGLGSASDAAVWQYARDHGFTIVTRDAEFHERSTIAGHPPKIVWIRRGNCSTRDIESILRRHAEDLRHLAESSEASVLVLL
jgi:predicted nuclease of predicted toxin-antitoxin system